jgi:hypothetical protein
MFTHALVGRRYEAGQSVDVLRIYRPGDRRDAAATTNLDLTACAPTRLRAIQWGMRVALALLVWRPIIM